MHIAIAIAKGCVRCQKIWSAALSISKIRPLRGQESEGLLGDVFAPNGELFGRFDTHLDTPAGSAQQGDLNRTIGEQLRHGHVGVRAVRRLDDYGFVCPAAEDEHLIKPAPAHAALWRRSFLEGHT